MPIIKASQTTGKWRRIRRQANSKAGQVVITEKKATREAEAEMAAKEANLQKIHPDGEKEVVRDHLKEGQEVALMTVTVIRVGGDDVTVVAAAAARTARPNEPATRGSAKTRSSAAWRKLASRPRRPSEMTARCS